MKFINALIFLLVSSFFTWSQVPQGIKYQAIARDEGGSILANQQIAFRASIIDSAQGGISVYSELHKSGTNKWGLFNVNIGEGSNPTGNFSNIQWSTGNKWLKLEMDLKGGTNYVFMGMTELLSV